MADTVLVRLRPYDRKRGCVLRSLTVQSIRFLEARGWYEVEREFADAFLRGLKQPPIGETPPDSTPTAFDIKTSQEAVDMEEVERKAREERAKAINPHRVSMPQGVLTTRDLPSADPPSQPDARSLRGRTSRRNPT